jgi:hypothetical protein
MPVEAHFFLELPQAFVAGEGEVNKLANLLSARIGALEIRADCADNTSRTFKTVEELGAFENPENRKIRQLVLSARSEDFRKRATIDLSGLRWGGITRWGGISLDLVADDDILLRLRPEVLELIGGMRPWYALLHRLNFVYIAALAYLLLWFTSLLLVSYKWVAVDNTAQLDSTGSARAQLVVLLTVAVLLVVGFGLNRLRDSLFPRAVFLIGQEKSRFQHLERVQWGIIIAFTVSLAAGILIAVWQALTA